MQGYEGAAQRGDGTALSAWGVVAYVKEKLTRGEPPPAARNIRRTEPFHWHG